MAKGIRLQPQGTNPLSLSEKGLWLNSSNELVVTDAAGNRNISNTLDQLTSGTGVDSISKLYLNNTGILITSGTPVYSPTSGLIDKASGNSATTARVIGVAAEDIAHGVNGKVAIFGVVPNVTGFTHGKYLYLSSTPGTLTEIEPSIPLYSAGFIVYIVGVIEGNNLIIQRNLVGTL